MSRTLFPIISAAHPADIDGLAILEDTANALYAFGIAFGLLVWALRIWFPFLAVSTLAIHRIPATIAFTPSRIHPLERAAVNQNIKPAFLINDVLYCRS